MSAYVSYHHYHLRRRALVVSWFGKEFDNKREALPNRDELYKCKAREPKFDRDRHLLRYSGRDMPNQTYHRNSQPQSGGTYDRPYQRGVVPRQPQIGNEGAIGNAYEHRERGKKKPGERSSERHTRGRSQTDVLVALQAKIGGDAYRKRYPNLN